MARKNGIFLIVWLALGLSARAGGFLVGATGQTGMIYPQKANENVALDKAIIDFEGFSIRYTTDHFPVPTASYKCLYDFANQGSNYEYVPSVLPLKLYFTRFDRASRSRVYDYLADLLPDLFIKNGSHEAIISHIREQFGHRVFIRQYLNVEDLDKLNVRVNIVQDDKQVSVQKAIAEFRLVDDQSGNKAAVLEMDLKLVFDLQMKPMSGSTVLISYAVPAFDMGDGDNLFFASVFLGRGRDWAGNISQLYMAWPALGATLTLPYYMEYKLFDLGYDKKLALFSDHEPEQFEIVGFYHHDAPRCECGNTYSDYLYWPAALKNVRASSYLKGSGSLSGTCAQPAVSVAVSRWVPPFEEGSTGTLSIFKDTLTSEKAGPGNYKSLLTNTCIQGTPKVSLPEKHSPWWAFDVGSDTIGYLKSVRTGHFNENTSWCEGVKGYGFNQYLEIEITQPVDALKFWTGDVSSEQSYNENSRVKKFVLTRVGGNYRKLLVFSDLHISSSLEDYLPPGKYRFTITEVYKGSKYATTCFAGLKLSFTLEDEWFRQNWEVLRKY